MFDISTSHIFRATFASGLPFEIKMVGFGRLIKLFPCHERLGVDAAQESDEVVGQRVQFSLLRIGALVKVRTGPFWSVGK